MVSGSAHEDELRQPNVMMFATGMTGHVAVKGQESLKYMLAKAVDVDEWPPKYCKLELALKSGSDDTCMAFCDSRCTFIAATGFAILATMFLPQRYLHSS